MMRTELRDESSQHPRDSRLTTALIALGLFALALTRLLVAIEHTPFNRDEARWVYHAGAIRHVLDPLGPAWGDTVVNRDQPPLAAYLFGVGQLAQGRPLDAVGWWNMSQSTAWNAKHGNLPAPADLLAARRTNAVAGALAAVALFLLVARLTNRAGGIVASLFLIAHPLATQLASTVDADTLLTLLILLAALAGVGLAERPSWPRAFVVGGLLGLGGAAKLTPLVIAVGLVGFVAVVVAAGRSNRSAAARARRYARMLGAQPIIAVVVFVAVSPYLWRDPIGRTRRLFAFRSQEMTNQRQIWPNLAITTPWDTLRRLWRLLGQRATASGWVTDQALRLAGASWRLPGVDLGLGLAGLAVIALVVRRVGVTSSTALAAAIVRGEAGVAVLGMRVYFARYLMPVTLALAASVGVFAGALWSARARWRALGSRTSSIGSCRGAPRPPVMTSGERRTSRGARPLRELVRPRPTTRVITSTREDAPGRSRPRRRVRCWACMREAPRPSPIAARAVIRAVRRPVTAVHSLIRSFSPDWAVTEIACPAGTGRARRFPTDARGPCRFWRPPLSGALRSLSRSLTRLMRGDTFMCSHYDPRSFDVATSPSATRRNALRIGVGGVALATSLTLGGRRVLAQATPSPSARDLPAPLDAWAAGWMALDAAQLAPLYAADAVFDAVALGTTFTGPDAITGYFGAYFAAFSEASVTITSGFVAGDRAAVEWMFTGRYTGQVPPLPPGTGQTIAYRGANVFELAGGTIRRETSYFDFATILIELGLLPAPATPVA